jgi:hypothetical protein
MVTLAPQITRENKHLPSLSVPKGYSRDGGWFTLVKFDLMGSLGAKYGPNKAKAKIKRVKAEKTRNLILTGSAIFGTIANSSPLGP